VPSGLLGFRLSLESINADIMSWSCKMKFFRDVHFQATAGGCLDYSLQSLRVACPSSCWRNRDIPGENILHTVKGYWCLGESPHCEVTCDGVMCRYLGLAQVHQRSWKHLGRTDSASCEAELLVHLHWHRPLELRRAKQPSLLVRLGVLMESDSLRLQ
jgi:hypothetical protein